MEAALKADGKTAEIPHLSGRAAQLRRRLPVELSQGCRGGRWNQMVGWFKKYGVLS